MKLINVKPEYINYLQSFSEMKTVMDSKFDVSNNGGRKYIGVCFKRGDFNYFIPIHKGNKEMCKAGKTYFDENGKLKIKRSKFNIEFIKTDSHGNESMEQILVVASMIPIPKDSVIDYDIKFEKDFNCKCKFSKLIRWFNTSKVLNFIQNRSEKFYNIKKDSLDGKLSDDSVEKKYASHWVNYILAEQKCAEWTNMELIKKIDKRNSIKGFEFYNLKRNNELFTVESELKDGYFISSRNEKGNSIFFLCNSDGNEIKFIKNISCYQNKDISNLEQFLSVEECSVVDLPTEEVKFDDIENTNKNITPKPKLKKIAKDNSKVMDLE